MKKPNPEWEAIRKRAQAIEELKLLEDCIIRQNSSVFFDSARNTLGHNRLDFVDNDPHCGWQQSLANAIFRPALKKALEDYRAALTDVANDEE